MRIEIFCYNCEKTQILDTECSCNPSSPYKTEMQIQGCKQFCTKEESVEQSRKLACMFIDLVREADGGMKEMKE